MQARYREQVKCIYIDPPYNTGGDGFIYKDGYQKSSWAALIHNRLLLAKPLLNQAGVIFQSIDDNEQANLKMISDSIFGKENFVSNICHKARASISNDKVISSNHNFLLFHAKSFNEVFNKREFFGIKADLSTYNKIDENGDKYKLTPVDGPGGAAKGNPYYEFKGVVGYWRYSLEKMTELYDRGEIVVTANNLQRKTYMKNMLHKRQTITTWWENGFLTSNATRELETLFLSKVFSNPKNINLIKQCVDISTQQSDLILDYFAGSGTAAHAVINLNREDKGNRQYILVEQGEYFDTVLKPRVQKVIYSKAWKDGKPVVEDKADNLQGVPQIVKVLKLESYEDTLNNLELRRSGLFDNLSDDVQQDYLLHYMLNLESRGSLLNVSHFEKPFDYGLNISTTSAGAYEWQKVDLVETFNYLIGANIISVDDKRDEQGFVAIECRLPNQSADEKTLIFWRDCERVSYDGLQKQFDRLGINPADSEYSQVYVNGDHTLETVWDGEQSGSLKIVSIEDAFLSLMFEGDA